MKDILLILCVALFFVSLTGCEKDNGVSWWKEQEKDTTYFTGKVGNITISGNLVNNNKSSYGDILVHTAMYSKPHLYNVEVNLNGEYKNPKFEIHRNFHHITANFPSLEIGEYAVINVEGSQPPIASWVYHEIKTYHPDGSLDTYKRYGSSSASNLFKLYVDNVQEDTKSIVPILSGRMVGYVFNELDAQDSLYLDLYFVSKSYDPVFQKK